MIATEILDIILCSSTYHHDAMKFQYTHLQPGSIRLFRFSQYATPTFIHGWLDHHSDYRNSSDAYSAIKYWDPDGAEAQQKSITLNGRSFMVPAVLWQALSSAVRYHNNGQSFWIEALSINAGDPREHGYQVAQMPSILACAKEVLVWIGDEDENSNAAFATLRTWSSTHRSASSNEYKAGEEVHLEDNAGESAIMQSILRRESVRNALDQPDVLQQRNVSVICGQHKCDIATLAYYRRSLTTTNSASGGPGSVL